MSIYTVDTLVPVTITIHVDDDDPTSSHVESVVVWDEGVPSTIEDVRAQGGQIKDENGLEVKPWYFNQRGFDEQLTKDGDPVLEERDWRGIESAYDDSVWPVWSIGG